MEDTGAKIFYTQEKHELSISGPRECVSSAIEQIQTIITEKVDFVSFPFLVAETYSFFSFFSFCLFLSWNI